MADNQEHDRNTSRQSTPEVDRGDVTPPHGDELTGAEGHEPHARAADELRREETFGRTDRYANQDDPEAEAPILEEVTLVSDDETRADARHRRMEQLDDAAANDARMAVRKREHSAD